MTRAKDKKMNMTRIEARHVNPFVEAAMRVLQHVAGIEVSRGHLSYKEKLKPQYDVSIVIGIQGFLRGVVVYSLSEQLALRLVDKLFERKPQQEKAILFFDGLAEVAEMIALDAVSLLSRGSDEALTTTTPAILAGADRDDYLSTEPALALGLATPYGPAEISIALEESEVLREEEISQSRWPGAMPAAAVVEAV